MSAPMFRHNLGDKVKDVVTGLAGIIVSRSESLFGCNRYWIQPQEHKDGKPVEGGWFDEESLEVVEPQVVKAPTYARMVVAIDGREVARTAAPARLAGGPSSQPAAATGPSSR